MSTELSITDDDTFEGTLTVPEDGDDANASTVQIPFQESLNQLAFLRKRIIGASEDIIVVPVHIMNGYTSGGWSINHTSTIGTISTAFMYWLSSSATAVQFIVPVYGVPGFGRIREVGVYLEGATGHAGLPATMPKVELIKFVDSTTTLVGEQSDTSANTTAYEARHSILLSGLTHSIDPLAAYFIRFTNEGSTNAATGLRVDRMTIGYSGAA